MAFVTTPAATAIVAGRIVHVQARPSYWATVTWSAELPYGRATVQPLPNQAVSERKRTVWKDKLTMVAR